VKALTWHGKRDVRVETVADPAIEEPTDAIVRVTSSGICGSDLHLYEVLGRSSTRVTSWATSRWASSRRPAPA
jgi:threonine dehydrogenase-like Zn-dependent dehydrogenase